MSTEINYWRVAMILLFVVTFTIVGWVSPVLVAANMPQDEIIEVHSFTATNTTPSAEQHYISFDRTVHRSATAQTFTELYMVSDDGTRIEIETNTADRYFQEGRTNVITPAELPDNLAEGEYRYVLVANFELADDRVVRTFAFHSEPFVVNESVDPKTEDELINEHK